MALGTGKYTYERVEGWGDLPEGWVWGQVGSVAVDSNDRVYVYTRTDHPLMIFERDGSFVRSWGEGIVSDAHGICLDAQGNMFMVDRNAQVAVKFTAGGDKVFELGNRDQPSDSGWTEDNRTVLRAAEPFHHPTDIALSANGDVYVSDGYRNARVHKFSADGKLILSWGEPGDGEGQFNLPHSVWEAKGRVYVADRQNNRLQVFTPEGKHLETWPGFLQPCKIFVDSDDIMYVAELGGRATICTLDGTVLAHLGGEGSDNPDQLVAPHGVWVDSHGDLYISEVLQSARLQKFERKG